MASNISEEEDVINCTISHEIHQYVFSFVYILVLLVSVCETLKAWEPKCAETLTIIAAVMVLFFEESRCFQAAGRWGLETHSLCFIKSFTSNKFRVFVQQLQILQSFIVGFIHRTYNKRLTGGLVCLTAFVWKNIS